MGRIPIDLQIVEEGDLGKSFIDTKSVASKAFIEIADSIEKIINKGGD